MPRVNITDTEVIDAVKVIQHHILEQRRRRGDHNFATSHEVLGLLHEEMIELTDAIRFNHHATIKEELIDVAVVATYGYASAKHFEW